MMERVGIEEQKEWKREKGKNNSTGEGGKGLGPDVAVMGVSWKK